MRRTSSRFPLSLLLVGAMLLPLLPMLSAPVGADTAAPAITGISSVVILVKDQDEALKWYTEKLGLEKKVDISSGGFRWLTLVPPGKGDPEIVLEKAEKGQEGMVGKSTAWVFATDDCERSYQTLKARGVVFTQMPGKQFYGTQAMFKDLYGNQFYLVSYPATPAAH